MRDNADDEAPLQLLQGAGPGHEHDGDGEDEDDGAHPDEPAMREWLGAAAACDDFLLHENAGAAGPGEDAGPGRHPGRQSWRLTCREPLPPGLRAEVWRRAATPPDLYLLLALVAAEGGGAGSAVGGGAPIVSQPGRAADLATEALGRPGAVRAAANGLAGALAAAQRAVKPKAQQGAGDPSRAPPPQGSPAALVKDYLAAQAAILGAAFNAAVDWGRSAGAGREQEVGGEGEECGEDGEEVEIEMAGGDAEEEAQGSGRVDGLADEGGHPTRAQILQAAGLAGRSHFLPAVSAVPPAVAAAVASHLLASVAALCASTAALRAAGGAALVASFRAASARAVGGRLPGGAPQALDRAAAEFRRALLQQPSVEAAARGRLRFFFLNLSCAIRVFLPRIFSLRQ